jgi:hypothetical protein
MSFPGQVSESLSDNTKKSSLRDRITVIKGSTSTLEEEKEDKEE